MSFDPKKHTIRVQGNREYLPVSARLVWFRQDHPDWSIVTAPVEINLEKQYAIFSATIMNADGKIVATGTKMENVKGFGDYLEKAETGAVGRALAMCGYGTQFAPELEEGGRFADAPQGPMSANRFASRPNGGGNGFNNRPGPMRGNGAPSGNGYAREDAPRPPAPLTAPEDENPFDSAATAPPLVRERAASAPGAPSPRPTASAAPAMRPAPPAPEARDGASAAPSGGITRVREPERDYTDPGGSDEPESPDDPFAEEFVAAPPRPSRPAPAPLVAEAEPAGPPRPNPLAGNNCSVPGCKNVLTPSQMTMSQQKFGKPLCLLHQRDPAVTGAARTADAL